MTQSDSTLILGSDCETVHSLSRALDADFEALPDLASSETFEGWRTRIAGGAQCSRVVLVPWNEDPKRGELMALNSEEWRERFEVPYLRWNFALGAAARRVRDNGAVVGVIQNPAALDAPGWTPEFAVGDGVLALIRSIAASEGARGVRANLVSTPIGLVTSDVILPEPPLPLFPGQVEAEVAGCVRLLLSPDSKGLTGRLLSADGGRSL